MTGYQSIEGQPSTANHWLLTEVLKDEWGFRGVIVTDWDNAGRLVKEQKVCADYTESAIVALRAGNDIIMVTPQFFEGALEAVRTGCLDETEIDGPCARLLALKFRMGLFEQPRRPDLQRATAQTERPDHRAVNLAAARQTPGIEKFLTPSFGRRLEAARKMLTKDRELFQIISEDNPFMQETVRQFTAYLDIAAGGDLDLLSARASWWWRDTA